MSVGQARGEDERAAALGYLEGGYRAFQAGDIAGATRQWSQAVGICRRIGAPDLEVQALARRGEAYEVAGSLQDAGNDLRAALAAAERSGDPRLIARTAGALGNLALVSRRTAVAEPLLLRSRDLAQRLPDSDILAGSENDLGNLYAATDRPGDASAAYQAAVANAGRAGDGTLATSAEVNAARLGWERGEVAQATALLTRASDRLSRLPPSYEGAMALVVAGSVVFERARAVPPAAQAIAYRDFQRAAEIADALGNATLRSLALGSLGRLYERAGRFDEASRLTAQALFAAQQSSTAELLYRWEWQQARLEEAQGMTDAALASYRRAVADLQSVRQDIPVEYRAGRSSYRVTFGPLYLEFTDLLLRRAPSHPRSAPTLIREARDAVEQLKETEFQDYFRDACVTSFEAKRRSIDTLAPGTAVLYPVSLPDRLEMLVSFGTELRQFTIPLPAAALRREVLQFREFLEKRETNQYLVPARQLYDQIIRPIEPALLGHHVDTLVIVPDDTLRTVPFAALNDGKGYLIERYATAIVPSLRLVDPRPLSASARTALVLGVSQSVQGYVSLPNVTQEVAAVHAIEGGDTLLDSSFSREQFASDLRRTPYSIVHIASHGQFGTDPSKTFVLAFDGRLTMDDLESDIKFGERRDNALELLILSACETASGDDRAALGLAGVALKAGARSALATLWYISDEASAKLVVAFHRALQSEGVSKAHALQAAQRALLHDSRFAHPAYWAPFLLIGNWL